MRPQKLVALLVSGSLFVTLIGGCVLPSKLGVDVIGVVHFSVFLRLAASSNTVQ